MGLFELFYNYFYGGSIIYPYCSRNCKKIPANLWRSREYYDGEVCPGDYFLTIKFPYGLGK